MKVKHLIDTLTHFDPNSEISVVHTNYGNPMEYELGGYITTKDDAVMLTISFNSQKGYYNTDRTEYVKTFS